MKIELTAQYEEMVQELVSKGNTLEEAEKWMQEASIQNDIAQTQTESFVLFENLSNKEFNQLSKFRIDL